jgi:phosphonate transport system permease protein
MTAPIAVSPLPASQRPTPPEGQRGRRITFAVIILVAGVWSVSGLDVTFSRLMSAPGEAWDTLRAMFPPDFSGEIERDVIPKVLESVYIAWIGTVIAAILSLPLAFLAANNVAPLWIRIPVRQLFNAIRSVPELIVAVILLAVTGLGPWAGALAIGLHSVGTLGKLATEAIENSDRGPMEAVEACGGRWISGMRWGVLPEVLPIVVSYWLFRFEINVRASAVLGMIGAGGVGAELVSQLTFHNFRAVGAVLAFTVGMVLVIDTVSASVRRRIIRGGGRGDGDSSRGAEALADLTGIAS